MHRKMLGKDAQETTMLKEDARKNVSMPYDILNDSPFARVDSVWSRIFDSGFKKENK
jgi:hypothetical protein